MTFDGLKTTTYGQTIKIAGNDTALGNWNTGSAIALSASDYTSSNPLWSGTIALTAGEVMQYKYILVARSGAVTWEADPIILIQCRLVVRLLRVLVILGRRELGGMS